MFCEIPDQLPGNYGVGLAYNQNTLRFGSADPEYHLQERAYNRALLDAQSKIVQLALRYARSYSSAETPTLLHLRDLLLACALTYLIRNAQCSDGAAVSLTTHADHFWQSDLDRNFWPDLSDESSHKFNWGGTIGSIAFYLTRHPHLDEDISPTDLIQSALKLFWEKLYIDPTSGLSDKHAAILAAMGVDRALFKAWSAALDVLNSRDPSEQPGAALRILQQLRASFLLPNDWQYLTTRLVLGEYSLPLIHVLEELDSRARIDTSFAEYYKWPIGAVGPADYHQRLLKLAPPAGSPLVYIALTIESFTTTCSTITGFGADVASMLYSDFCSDSRYEEQRISLARTLTTAYDAMGMLSWFNTFVEAKGTAHRLYVTINQLLNQVSDSNSTSTASASELILKPEDDSVYRLGGLDDSDLFTLSTPQGLTEVGNLDLDYDELPVVQTAPIGIDDDGSRRFAPSRSLLDVLVAAVNTATNLIYAAERVDLSATSNKPTGGSGQGTYSEMGVENPELRNPYLEANLAGQTLQGTNKMLLQRLRSWSSGILEGVHADSTDPKSEVSVIRANAPLLDKLVLGRYQSYVSKAAATAGEAATALLADYAYGNSVVRTSGTKQYAAGQFRVSTSSIAAFDTPQLLLCSQQTIAQSRFYHLNTDLYQHSSVQYWLRAEDHLTLMAGRAYRYNSVNLTEISANSRFISGSEFRYADAIWTQAGQSAAGLPLHPKNTRYPLGTGYGQSINLAMRDYFIEAKTGVASVKAGVSTIISGGVVLINCRGSASASKLPRRFSQMADPKPYAKQSASSSQGRYQIGDRVPEPPVVAGAPSAGAYLSSYGSTTPPNLP